MKDLIERQKAMEAMCELMHHWFGGDPKDEIREIKRELEKLPPAQPNLQPTCNQLATDTISRQAAKLKVARVIWEDGDSCYDFHDKCVDCLDDVPSAEPEIIRCRDCKNWETTWTNNWSPDYHYCPKIDEVRKGNFHCRYAERRADE